MDAQRLIDRGDGSMPTTVWHDRIDPGAADGGIVPFDLLRTRAGKHP